jgi:hypothetical protein
MSTHAIFRFVDEQGTNYATVYRHSDGYLECGGRDIFRFFDAVREQTGGDTRFGDPSYLAAKYVVWLAFRSVGLLPDGTDCGEAFRYTIRCHHWHEPWESDAPRVTYQEMTDWTKDGGAVWSEDKPLALTDCEVAA